MTERRAEADLFADALALEPDARARFLDDACGGDAALRARIEKLLAAHPQAQRLFGSPRPPVSIDAPDNANVDIGRQVGAYRLTSFVASGGMGSVYIAERIDRAFEKRVAVKILRIGLGTSEFLARFRNERQVLADFEHPNIARLIDGGSTPEDVPYIVMEYVDGEPIDRYCDARALPLDARLRLFAEACEAVQYAHGRLVIHRDLKPSNILVDASGRVKLLDFGIAKVLQPAGVEREDATRTSLRMLTPRYASPEQIRGDRLGTATDIYSLGVILYELLAGATTHRIEGKTASEIERIVCSEEPVRPSRRLAIAEAGARDAAAARRGTTWRRLARDLAGDLDTIILRALAKDSARRYTTVEELSADIRRHSKGEPVLARADSASYRLSKFARRNTAAIAGAGAFVALLIVFAATMALQAKRIANERDRANQAAVEAHSVSAFLQEMLGSVDPTRPGAPGREVTVREALDDAARKLETGSLAGQPEIEATVRATLAASYRGLGLYAEAEPHASAALEIRRASDGASSSAYASALSDLAKIRYHQGNYASADSILREALEIRRAVLGPSHPDVAIALNDLGVFRWEQGDLAAAESLYREAVDLQRASPNVDGQTWASSLVNLAQIVAQNGNLESADTLLKEGLVAMRAALGGDHPDVAATLNHLGQLSSRRGDLVAADSLYRAALAIQRRAFGGQHDKVAGTLNNLAFVSRSKGDFAAAEQLYGEALAIWHKTLGDSHPNVATGIQNLGRVIMMKGDFAAADSLFREALSMRRRALGNEHPDVAYSAYELGVLRLDMGDNVEGERLLREAYAIQTAKLTSRDSDIGQTATALGRCLLENGRQDEAEPFLEVGHSILSETRPDHWRRFEAMSLLGAALAARGEQSEAESLLVPAFESISAISSAPALRKEQSLARVVAFYSSIGKSSEAAAWLARADASSLAEPK